MKLICFNQWSELPASADALFEEAEKQSIFLSRVWLENTSTYALPNDHLLCLASVIEGDRCLAVLPMMTLPDGTLRSLSSNFTSLFSLIISNEQQESVIQSMAEGLADLPVKPIQLEPIDSDDKNLNQLIQTMQTHGFDSHPYFRFYNWKHALQKNTYEEYIVTRPSHLRNLLQRKQNKLKREHHYEFKLYINKDTDKAVEEYQTVYLASWKANEFYQDFTPNIIKKAANKEWLRLGVLYINNQPIAAQIWLVLYNKANIYRLVYDEKWKQYSPGSLLTQHLMQYVIDTDRVSEIDFLTGNENYKQDWMSIRNERVGVRLMKRDTPKSLMRRIIDRL